MPAMTSCRGRRTGPGSGSLCSASGLRPVATCGSCQGRGEAPKTGLHLTSREAVLRDGAGSPAAVPGEAATSLTVPDRACAVVRLTTNAAIPWSAFHAALRDVNRHSTHVSDAGTARLATVQDVRRLRRLRHRRQFGLGLAAATRCGVAHHADRPDLASVGYRRRRSTGRQLRSAVAPIKGSRRGPLAGAAS